MKFTIREACDRAIIRFKNDGNAVGVAIAQIAVEAVVGNIELAVFEPLVERRLRFVQYGGEGLVPVQVLASETCSCIRDSISDIPSPAYSLFSATISGYAYSGLTQH